MKKVLIPFTILIFLSQSWVIIAQDTLWPKVYMVNTQINDVIETYDGGIACTGTVKLVGDNNAKGYGFVKKLDINGNTLWQKYFGMYPPPGRVYGYALSQTSDGGFIITATTNVYDYSDLLIMKLNACGEKEWERIFHSPGPQLIYPIYELEDGSFMTVVCQWGEESFKNIWLFKLAADGRTLWQKYMGYWDPPSTNAEYAQDFIKSSDSNFVISGWGGVLEPEIDTVHWWTRPLFIKVDTAGNELWHNFIVGIGEEFVKGKAKSGDTDSQGIIYCAGSRSDNGPGRPAIFKVSSTGETIFHEDISIESDSVVNGFAFDIRSMTDTSFYAFVGILNTTDTVKTYAYKLDSSGTVLDRKLLLDTASLFWPMGSVTTHDNKYIAASYDVVDGNRYSYLWKLQSNLEYDTLYTMPRVYDSLCPYPIISDTIPLDTTTVINLEHIWKSLTVMSVFPNPAWDKLRIAINIVKWQQRQLRATNLNGQEIYNETIAPGRANHEVDISSWPPGIYVFSIFEKGVLLQTEKVVVVR